MTQAVLVDYRCGRCHRLREEWVSHPIPPLGTCVDCGGSARRVFGAALLRGVPITPPRSVGDGRDACDRSPAVPGSCALIPTAARMLDARLRRDNRKIERELAYQEGAVRRGELNPASSLVTRWSGGPHGDPVGEASPTGTSPQTPVEHRRERIGPG